MLPPPAPQVVIHADYGGQVGDFQRRVAAYLKRGVRVRIEGECASACTMVTAVPADRICVAPGARLEFHQAYHPNPGDETDTSNRSAEGTAILWSTYPAGVRAWILDHGGLTKDLITLEGPELEQLFRVCLPGAGQPEVPATMRPITSSYGRQR